ncbi:MAG TPA: DMT family transporter [Geminicoccus sp.]|uniref:DMT family transporter n=1 Tax=Geminicoccus sp. TaxID=2024832 RepID=UPI002B518D85|nr:DMT family transporter [Geminicoccus sp.]HWL70099.1 DMT family transporter [Geminicoccus sp.]
MLALRPDERLGPPCLVCSRRELALPTAADNLRAALLMAFASVVFTINDALVKVLTGEGVPIGLILAVRGVFMVLIFLVLFRGRGDDWRLYQFRDPLVVLRACAEAALSWVMFTSLMLLPIATVTALFFTTPMLATALGALFLGERVRIWRWTAVVLGFVGILIATRPGSAAFEPTLLLPLLAALIAALRDLITRRLAHGIPTRVVAMSTTVATCLSGFASVPFLPWPPLELPLVGILAGSALISGVALFAYIGASRLGEISFLAPIRYLSLPTAGLLGFLIWGDLPDRFALLGTALIVGSGVLIFYREQRLARRR